MLLAHALPEGVAAFPLAGVITGLVLAQLGLTTLLDRRRGPERTAPSSPPAADPHEVVASGTARVVGLVGFVVVVLLAGFGSPVASRNYADVAVLGLLWGVVVLTSLLAGDVWARVDPLAGLDLLRGGGDGGVLRPVPLGAGLAGTAVSMTAWAWAQLLWEPGREAFLVALLTYCGIHLALAARLGHGWLAAGEALRQVAATLGRIPPWGVGRTSATPTDSDQAGPLLVSSVLVGWALTDLVVESAPWIDLTLSVGYAGGLGLAVLVTTIGTVWVVLRRVLGWRMALAAVPLAAGWAVAQHVPRLVVEVQGLLLWLADPLDVGVGIPVLVGTLVDPSPSVAVVVVQLACFLGGHVLAARAVRSLALAHVSGGSVSALTAFPRLLLLVSLVGGAWLQLAGI